MSAAEFKMQTRFDAEGNCFEACIASLVGCEVEAVPAQASGPGDMRDYISGTLNSWLARRGLQALVLFVNEVGEDDSLLPDAYWIAHVATSQSDEWNHALIARKLEIVWNPDPRGGPDALTADNLEAMTWIVPAAAPTQPTQETYTREQLLGDEAMDAAGSVRIETTYPFRTVDRQHRREVIEAACDAIDNRKGNGQ